MSKKGGKGGKKKDDAKAPGTSAAEKTEQMAKDATIALFQQMDKEKISSLAKEIAESREDNAKLRLQVEKGQRETHDFVAYFQRELEAKDALLKKRAEIIAGLEEQLDRETKALRHNAKTTASALEHGRKEMELKFTSDIELLKNELKALDLFRQQKAGMEAKIEQLEKEIMALQLESKEDLDNVERKFTSDRSKMKKEFEQEAERLKQMAQVEIEKGLDAETKRIFRENASLKEELRFIRGRSETLDKDNERLRVEVKKLRMEAQVTHSTGQEHAKKGHKKGAQVRDLTNEIVDLEAQLKQVREHGIAESSKHMKALSKEAERHAEVEKALRQMLKIKNRELAHVKGHAKTILEQRTEVEQFFLDALEQCKQMIEEQRKKQQREELLVYRKKMHEARVDKKPFPKILGHRELSNPVTASKLPADPETKVHLADLSWEDRERVLKLLFAKINGARSIPVAKLPDHSIAQSF